MPIYPHPRQEAEMWSKIMQAVKKYQMIEKGDRIAVGVSGGKDSLTLLRFLKLFQQYQVLDFEMVAIHMYTADLSSGNISDPNHIRELCEEWEIPYDEETVHLTDPQYNKKNKIDCYWCSFQKRRVLFKMAEKHQCNKIAFGHHADDAVITAFMNMFYLSAMIPLKPFHPFFGGKYYVIRPLIFLRESEIMRYAKILGFPSLPCNCPVGKNGRREQLKDLLDRLEKEIPEIVHSVSAAMLKNEEKLEKIGMPTK